MMVAEKRTVTIARVKVRGVVIPPITSLHYLSFTIEHEPDDCAS
jgi:hypothetical protein